MIHALTAGLVTLGSLVAPIVISPSPKAPADRITIDVVSVNGSGCPIGSTAVAPSVDNTAFTVTYGSYLAAIGPGIPVTDFRKNCQLSLRINVPQGFTYAIASVDYRGYAYLAAGASGLEQANYYFMGSGANAMVGHTFKGPMDANWQTTDKADIAAMVWAPCGVQRNLNINTELRVYAGTSDPDRSTSLMTMDSTDTDVSTIYHLSWRSC